MSQSQEKTTDPPTTVIHTTSVANITPWLAMIAVMTMVNAGLLGFQIYLLNNSEKNNTQTLNELKAMKQDMDEMSTRQADAQIQTQTLLAAQSDKLSDLENTSPRTVVHNYHSPGSATNKLSPDTTHTLTDESDPTVSISDPRGFDSDPNEQTPNITDNSTIRNPYDDIDSSTTDVQTPSTAENTSEKNIANATSETDTETTGPQSNSPQAQGFFNSHFADMRLIVQEVFSVNSEALHQRFTPNLAETLSPEILSSSLNRMVEETGPAKRLIAYEIKPDFDRASVSIVIETTNSEPYIVILTMLNNGKIDSMWYKPDGDNKRADYTAWPSETASLN